MVRLEVQYAVEADALPDRATLASWVQSAFAHRDRGELTLRIVGRREMQQLNNDYRRIDRVTNVLAFPANWEVRRGVPYLGDIAVCADVVREEASDPGKRLLAHWAHIVLHGILHLLGYDHQDDRSARQMAARETALLAQHGFTDPYAGEWLDSGSRAGIQ